MTYVSQSKKIFYRVTYLEMNKPPLFNWPTPINKKISLLESKNIPVWYFLFLYKSVGSEYDWTDQLLKTNDEINELKMVGQLVFLYLIIEIEIYVT
jgi:quinol-cytochrome oxidoreductase complex cytochrome b subunit